MKARPALAAGNHEPFSVPPRHENQGAFHEQGPVASAGRQFSVPWKGVVGRTEVMQGFGQGRSEMMFFPNNRMTSLPSRKFRVSGFGAELWKNRLDPHPHINKI